MATSEREATGVSDRDDFLGLSSGELKELLREMEIARRFEEKAAESYQMGKIGGFCHLYIGQEAVAVGAISALREDDYVIASYRSHAHALIRGMAPGRVMAELYGRADGVSGGHGGSMHLFAKELNFLGGVDDSSRIKDLFAEKVQFFDEFGQAFGDYGRRWQGATKVGRFKITRRLDEFFGTFLTESEFIRSY